ncbi:hypothetical protein As57867_018062, partial [Aphanomyces stellatus]
GTASCGECGEPYHLLTRCRDRAGLAAWRRARDVRACPNCHASIEKLGGCTHMTCSHCDFEFCWLCRVDWTRHTELMCKPRAFLESTAYGPTAPLRAVTKSMVVVAALAAAAVAAGVAVVVVPPMLLFDGAKDAIHRQKQSQTLKKLKQSKATHAET